MTRILVRSLPGLLLVVLGLVFFASTGHDDAYITFWAAHTLSTVGKILNYNRDVFEQSSSLFLTVVLAIGNRLTTISVPHFGFAVALFFGVLAIYQTGHLARLTMPSSERAAVFALALCPPLIYWSYGGMEATCVAFFAVLLIEQTCVYVTAEHDDRRAFARVAITCVLFLTTRPEIPIVVAAVLIAFIAVSFLIGKRDPQSHGLRWAQRTLPILAVSLAAFALLLLARKAYFGRFFPQPVYVKAHRSISSFLFGFYYVINNLHWGTALLAVGALVTMVRGAIAIKRKQLRSPIVLLLSTMLLTYVAFIVVGGGDWMEGGRFLVPILPMLALLGVDSIPKSRRWQIPAIAAIGVLQVWGIVNLTYTRSMGSPIWVKRPEVKGADWLQRSNVAYSNHMVLYEQLKHAVSTLLPIKKAPVVVVNASAGIVYYYIAQDFPGQVIFEDRYCLVTREFSDCPVNKDVTRDPMGLDFDVDFYFSHMQAMAEACNVKIPDIIVDFAQGTDLVWDVHAQRAGYQIIARVFALPVHDPVHGLPPDDAPINQFIAVRGEYAHLFPKVE